ncbi:MAG: patatin-like phospholipase family protein [Saccharofermentanales bacterium]
MSTEYALALAGGGTRGAYQVGAWRAIREMEISVCAVAGTSIGAINGALIAQGDYDIFDRLYQEIRPDQILETGVNLDFNRDVFHITNFFKMSGDFLRRGGYRTAPLRKVLEEYIDVDKVYDSAMDYGLVTFELGAVHPVEKFKAEITKDQFLDYLLASACFPIFKAQRIENKVFTDGGLGDNLPVNMLACRGYKQIIAVDLHGIGIIPAVTVDDVYIKTVRPTVSLGGLLDFNREKIQRNTLMGYMDTLKAFNRLQGDMYFFSPHEFKLLLDRFNSRIISDLEKAAAIYGLEKYAVYSAADFCEEVYELYKESVRNKNDLKVNLLNIRELASEFEKIRQITNKKMLLSGFVSQARVSPLHLSGVENTLFAEYAGAARAILELERLLSIDGILV